MWWPFTKQREVIDEDYALWLRAQRPPFDWFMRQPPDVQDLLAELGDEHHESFAILVGRTILDPRLAEAQVEATDEVSAEQVLLQRLTAEHVAKHFAGRHQPPVEDASPDPLLSFAGIGRRREAAARAREEASREESSFLGRPPDGVRSKYPLPGAPSDVEESLG